jgi:hypothetical protein
MKASTDSKIYSFKSQEIKGKYGERILDNWHISLGYKILDVSDTQKYRDIGIDRILMRPDGSTVNVEYKFDLASARTGNLFFETVSVDCQNTPGWGWSSQADYWIFLLPSREILVVEPKKMRNLVWQYREVGKDKEVPNLGYKTRGIPIPIKQVRLIAHHRDKLSPQMIDIQSEAS